MKLQNFVIILLIQLSISGMEQVATKGSSSKNSISSFTDKEYELYKFARRIADTIDSELKEICEENEVIDQRNSVPEPKPICSTMNLRLRKFFPYRTLITPWGTWNFVRLADDAKISEEGIAIFEHKINKKFFFHGTPNDLYKFITDKNEEINDKKIAMFLNQKTAQLKWDEMTKKYKLEQTSAIVRKKSETKLHIESIELSDKLED